MTCYLSKLYNEKVNKQLVYTEMCVRVHNSGVYTYVADKILCMKIKKILFFPVLTLKS